jgi:hypothetical protein
MPFIVMVLESLNESVVKTICLTDVCPEFVPAHKTDMVRVKIIFISSEVKKWSSIFIVNTLKKAQVNLIYVNLFHSNR